MIARWRGWFEGRSLREQRLLLVMAALLVLVLLWAAIILPVTDGLAAARDRQAAAATLLADTRTRVAAVRDLERHRPPALGATLDTVVRARASDAGFALANLTAMGPDRVQITITQARPGALIAWLAGLEDSGVLVDTLALNDNGDRTVAVQASLKARAS